MDDAGPQHLGRRIALFAGVLAVAALALFTVPGVADVRERLTSANPWWILVAGVCSLGSMLGFVLVLWCVFDRAMGRRQAVVLGLAEQGANVLLPAGGASGPALGALVLRRVGVPGRLAAERHAVLFLVTSLISFVGLLLAGTLVAIGVLPGDASLLATLGPAVAAAAVLGAAVAAAHAPRRDEPDPSRRARHALWRLGRFVGDGLRETIARVRRGDRMLVAGAVAYYALDMAALGVAFVAVGGDAPPVGLFVLAYTLGHAGALLPTPGGLGGTEGGLVAMFTLYGTDPATATAAVLGYRVFQLGLPVVLGSLALVRITKVVADGPRQDGPLTRASRNDSIASTSAVGDADA